MRRFLPWALPTWLSTLLLSPCFIFFYKMGLMNCLCLLNLTDLSFPTLRMASRDRSTMILSPKYISLERVMLFFPWLATIMSVLRTRNTLRRFSPPLISPDPFCVPFKHSLESCLYASEWRALIIQSSIEIIFFTS